MSQFKSQFMNIMLERGFYNQCTNEDGLTPTSTNAKLPESLLSAIWAQIRQATVFMSAISYR